MINHKNLFFAVKYFMVQIGAYVGNIEHIQITMQIRWV